MIPRRFLGGGGDKKTSLDAEAVSPYFPCITRLPRPPLCKFPQDIKNLQIFLKSCIKCAVEVKTRTNVTVKEMRTNGRKIQIGMTGALR